MVSKFLFFPKSTRDIHTFTIHTPRFYPITLESSLDLHPEIEVFNLISVGSDSESKLTDRLRHFLSFFELDCFFYGLNYSITKVCNRNIFL